MRNNLIFGSVLIVIGLTVVFNVITYKKEFVYKVGVSPVYDKAVAQARMVLKQRKAEGLDLTFRPCLTNDLFNGWAADLVHKPRNPIDDKLEYQCGAYLNGRATHLVELDVEGNIINIK